MTRSLSPRSKEPITTAADLPRAMSGGQQEPELAQRARVAPPVPAHAHGEPQEHRDAEEGLQLAPRLGADALEHGAALADQNPLLRLLLDEDGGVDVQPLGPLVLDEVLDAHGHRVRHLLVREVEDLLAHDLRDVERLGLVARRVGREEQGVLRQRAHEEVEQAVAVGAVGGGDGQQLLERVGAAPALEERQEPALRLHAVHLVERAEDGPGEGAQRRQHEVVRPFRRGGVDDQADDVDLLGGALGRLLHELAEPAAAGVPWVASSSSSTASGTPSRRACRAAASAEITIWPTSGLASPGVSSGKASTSVRRWTPRQPAFSPRISASSTTVTSTVPAGRPTAASRRSTARASRARETGTRR